MSQTGVHAYSPNAGNTVGLCFIAFLLPPIPVFLVRGVHADLLINFLLFIFGWLPGVIHAIYIVCKYANPKRKTPKAKYDINASRHAPNPGPVHEPAKEVHHSTEQSGPVVHPFLAGGGSASGSSPPRPEFAPAVQGNVQSEEGHERDLPVYEEVAGGSQIRQGTLRGDIKRELSIVEDIALSEIKIPLSDTV